MFDVIVVGGGPSGLAAAMTLGRALRSTLVIDSGEPRNAPAPEMHNFISRDGTPPSELRGITRQELERYSTVELRDTTVVSATSLGDGAFDVRLADGAVERSRRLLLATGLVDELPAVDGLAELWGRGVFHCPYCHGFEVRDTALAVLGAEQSAVHLALHLTRFSRDVVLCTNAAGELDAETRALLTTQSVPVRDEAIARLEGSDGHLERVVFAGGETFDRDAMFCGIARLRQRSDLPAQLGCTTFEDGCVEVNDFGQTSVPGVYAVGDMSRRASLPGPTAAVIAAAASGTLAGVAIDKELLATDVGIHNPLAGARA
jgi:thioredoxin reductase